MRQSADLLRRWSLPPLPAREQLGVRGEAHRRRGRRLRARRPACRSALPSHAQPLGAAARHEPRGRARCRTPTTPRRAPRSACWACPRSALSAIGASGSSSGSHPGRLTRLLAGRRRELRAHAARSTPARPSPCAGSVRASSRTHELASPTTSWSPTRTRCTYTAAGQHRRKDYNEEQHFHSAPTLQPPVLAVTAHAGANGARVPVHRPLQRARPERPDDLRRRRRTGLVRPAGRRSRCDQPAGAAAAAASPVLTWWQGYIPPQGFGQGEEMIYSTLLPAGRTRARRQRLQGRPARLPHHAPGDRAADACSTRSTATCRRSAAPAAARSPTACSRKSTSRTGLVRREWHSLDHVGLSESYSARRGRQHPVAVRLLPHQLDRPARRQRTTLITARNTWALYELNTTTGPGRAASRRQAQQRQARLTAPRPPSSTTRPCCRTARSACSTTAPCRRSTPSRARSVLSIDPHAHTDTLLARYEHPESAVFGQPGQHAGAAPTATCSSAGARSRTSRNSAPPGSCCIDAHWHGSYQSYRAYRFPWSGTPAAPPAIAASAPASKRSGERVRELERRHRSRPAGACSRAPPRHSSPRWRARPRAALRRRSPHPDPRRTWRCRRSTAPER